MSSMEDFKIQKILGRYIEDLINDCDRDNPEIERRMLKTGFRTFDELVSLYEKENTVVSIAMYGDTGKTGFLMTLMKKLIANEKKVLLYSTVNTRRHTMDRLISVFTDIPAEKFDKCNTLTAEEINNIEQCSEALYDSSTYIVDGRPIELDTFIDRVNEAIEQDLIDIVLIDDADYLSSYAEIDPIYEKLRKINAPVITTVNVEEINYEHILSGDFEKEMGKPDYTVAIEQDFDNKYNDCMQELEPAMMFVGNPEGEVRKTRLLYSTKSTVFTDFFHVGPVPFNLGWISEKDRSEYEDEDDLEYPEEENKEEKPEKEAESVSEDK